jgi:cell wall-associated NlpC family hydrolase
MCLTSRISITFLALAAVAAHSNIGQPPKVSRTEMLTRARELAEIQWSPTKQSETASCLSQSTYHGPKYVPDFKSGEKVTGLPYDWGGDDSSTTFSRKLATGKYAAGSHQKHECVACGHCTIGTDCSGLVSYCWHLPRHFGTSELSQFSSLASDMHFNIYKDLRSGDALLSPGHHVVLFDKYDVDGAPIVYEASGSDKRVVHQAHRWAYFNRTSEPFVAIRYISVTE